MEFAPFAAQELAALAERLSSAAAKDVESATRHVTETLSASIAALRAEQAQLAAEHNDAAAALARAEAVLRDQQQAADTAAREREQIARDLEQATRELADVTRDLEQTRRDRDAALEQAAREHASALEEAARDHTTALDKTARQHAAAAADTARAHAAALEQTAREHAVALDHAARERDRVQKDADAIRVTEAGARASLQQELDDMRRLLEAARAAHRGALVGRLQAVFDHIGRSTTVDHVLEAIAQGLAADFTRVAVFTVHDSRLEVTYQSGFDDRSAIARTIVPVTGDSLLARTASGDDVLTLAADALADKGRLPFGGAPHAVVTAPIKVRGETLAVLYADDSGRTDPPDAEDDRASLTDVLRHHAMVRLDRLTIELKTVVELRAYAKMLLDEVEYVYAADASSGKGAGERQERLYENLRCARQIYQQRVTIEGPAAASLLEEQVAAALEAKAATPFGRDLALVVARPDDAELGSPGAAAQAS